MNQYVGTPLKNSIRGIDDPAEMGIPGQYTGAAYPLANSAEITASNAAWTISDSSIPAGTKYIRVHAFGCGGIGPGGAGGAYSMRQIYNTAGLDGLSLNITISASNSGNATTVVGTGINLTAGGAIAQVEGAADTGVVSIDYDVTFIGGPGGNESGSSSGSPYGAGKVGASASTGFGTTGAGGAGWLTAGFANTHPNQGGGGSSITVGAIGETSRGGSGGLGHGLTGGSTGTSSSSGQAGEAGSWQALGGGGQGGGNAAANVGGLGGFGAGGGGGGDGSGGGRTGGAGGFGGGGGSGGYHGGAVGGAGGYGGGGGDANGTKGAGGAGIVVVEWIPE